MSGKLVNYITLMRPFTLLAPFFAGFFGVLAVVNDVYVAISAGCALMFAQTCGQIVNQYADIELDKIVKPHRPLPSGKISPEEAIGLAWLSALLAVLVAFLINTIFGFFVILLLFFAVFYSLPPFSPRKINCFLNITWISASRGLIPMLAIWSFCGIEDGVKYAIYAFLWCLALQPTKDIGDIEGDRRFGVKTIVVEYGLTNFMIYVVVMFAIIYIYAFLFLPLMLTMIPFSVVAVLGLRRKVRGVENNLAWVMFYIGLIYIYICMFLTEYFS